MKERKITATYINRYKQSRYLHDDGNGEVWITGEMVSLRIGGEPNKITMVDPDGGPYISVGEDIEPYFEDEHSRVVERIVVSGVIKLFYKTENK